MLKTANHRPYCTCSQSCVRVDFCTKWFHFSIIRFRSWWC